jgi:hypothetical protein
MKTRYEAGGAIGKRQRRQISTSPSLEVPPNPVIHLLQLQWFSDCALSFCRTPVLGASRATVDGVFSTSGRRTPAGFDSLSSSQAAHRARTRPARETTPAIAISTQPGSPFRISQTPRLATTTERSWMVTNVRRNTASARTACVVRRASRKSSSSKLFSLVTVRPFLHDILSRKTADG